MISRILHIADYVEEVELSHITEELCVLIVTVLSLTHRSSAVLDKADILNNLGVNVECIKNLIELVTQCSVGHLKLYVTVVRIPVKEYLLTISNSGHRALLDSIMNQAVNECLMNPLDNLLLIIKVDFRHALD